MASRELTYRITLSTSDAKRQAANIRATFERELRQIRVGNIDTSSLKGATNQAKLFVAELDKASKVNAGEIDTSHLQRATSEAQRLRQELEQAGAAAGNIRPSSIGGTGGGLAGLGNLGGLGNVAIGGLAVGATIQGLRQIGSAIDDLSRRGAIFTQLRDVLESYTKAVGSSADAWINAAKKASAGTIAEYELILNANRALQFEVAKTPEQYAKLIELSTALGRAQGISDTTALEYLTTGLARESRLILDNLGLIINISDANEQYADSIGKAADQLTTAERKQALLNEAFRQGEVAIQANRDAADSTATAIERFDANMTNLRDNVGKLTAELLNVPMNKLAELAGYAADLADDGRLSVDTKRQQIKNNEAAIAELEKLRMQPTLFGMQEASGATEQIDEYRENIRLLRQEIKDMTLELARTEFQPHWREETGLVGPIFDKSEMANFGAIEAEFQSMQDALMNRAKELVPELGVEQVATALSQARQQLNAAMDEMLKSGIADPDAISLQAAEIFSRLSEPFDRLEERASTVDFSGIATAINSLNTADMELFPDLAGVRDDLAGLYEEIGYGTTITMEQAAELDYLQSVAAAYADSTSDIAAVQDELGREFLESNGYAASLVEQMYMADGAYRAGIISSAQYAGILAALTGNLYTVANGAGVATGAILALAAAQAGFASMPGYSAGFSQGNAGSAASQAAYADAARENNRKEADRVAKEQARQAKQLAQYNDRAARSAAKQAESSAKKAGQELEKAAKKAGQELVNALKGVEGLFDSSSVTEGDMKLGSAYKDKADEYLRRLRDEVENGIDWPDVSIEEAAEAIKGLGLEVAGSKEAVLAQFEELHNSSALYANEENIGKFINDEAVQYGLRLQELAKQGEENIYKHFGVIQEDAIESSMGTGASYTPPAPPTFDPIESANFIDVDPLTEGLQTGLDDLVDRTAVGVQQSLSDAKAAFFDATDLFGTGNKDSVFGPMPKPELTVTADASAAPFADALAASGNSTIGIAPTIDIANLQTELDEMDLVAEVKASLNDESLLTINGIITALTPKIEAKVSLDAENLLTINGLITALTPKIKAKVGLDAENLITVNGLIAALTPNVTPTITYVTVAEDVNVPDIGVMAVLNKFAIDETALRGADLTVPVGIRLETPTAEPGVDPKDAPSAITPLIQGINAQIRASTTDIKREGASVAQILIAGMIAHWQAGQSGEEEGAVGSIAAALMTNVSAQFDASQNMFYALGFIPAGNVEDGFKAHQYTDMDSGILDSITNGIRKNAENYEQRGATIGSYVQRGLNDSFSSEVGVALAVAAGTAWGSAFQRGVLNQLSAGSGIAQAITDKVMADIATELEQP